MPGRGATPARQRYIYTYMLECKAKGKGGGCSRAYTRRESLDLASVPCKAEGRRGLVFFRFCVRILFAPLARYVPCSLSGAALPHGERCKRLRTHSVHGERNYILFLRNVRTHARSREGFVLSQSPLRCPFFESQNHDNFLRFFGTTVSPVAARALGPCVYTFFRPHFPSHSCSRTCCLVRTGTKVLRSTLDNLRKPPAYVRPLDIWA